MEKTRRNTFTLVLIASCVALVTVTAGLRMVAANDESTLTVNIVPEKAVTEGAEWSLKGSGVWRRSGDTVAGLDDGDHVVVTRIGQQSTCTPATLEKVVFIRPSKSHQFQMDLVCP